MCSDANRGGAGERAANLIRVSLDIAGDVEIGDRTVEAAFVPEIVFGTAKTAVTGLNGPR